MLSLFYMAINEAERVNKEYVEKVEARKLKRNIDLIRSTPLNEQVALATEIILKEISSSNKKVLAQGARNKLLIEDAINKKEHMFYDWKG